MTRAGLFYFFFSLALLVAAQEDRYPEISISSVNSLESKTLTRDFFGDYYFGGYIDSTEKWSAIDKLDEKNRLGFFSLNRAEVRLPSKKQHSVYVAGTHQSLLGIGFTNGLFQLVFAGNHSLVGQTVQMDPGSLNQYYFSSVAGGIIYPLNDDIRAFAAVGPVCLYSYSNLDFSGSSFFTSEAADSLSLRMKGTYTRAGGPAYIKGIGFGAEIGIEGKTGSFEWKLMAGNIGRVWLNDRTIDSQRDTTMKFTGVEVTDLAGFSAVVEQELDNFEEGFSLKGDTTATPVSLPLYLSGECRTEFGKLRTDLGILYYQLPGFFPFVSLTPSWPVFDVFRVALPVKYGGFGSFNAGVGFEVKMADRITLSIDFPSLLTFTGSDRNLSYVACGKLIYNITRHESLL